MKAQSLDWSAKSSRRRVAREGSASRRSPRLPALRLPASAATSASSARRAGHRSSATRGESQVSRSLPSPQLDSRSVPLLRLVPFERFGKRRERQTGAARLLDHRCKPRRALVPPVTEQLGVERADQQSRTAALRAVAIEPFGRAPDEVARMLARALRKRPSDRKADPSSPRDAAHSCWERGSRDKPRPPGNRDRPRQARSSASRSGPRQRLPHLPPARADRVGRRLPSGRRRRPALPPAPAAASMPGRKAHSGSQKPPVHDPNRARCESIPVRT